MVRIADIVTIAAELSGVSRQEIMSKSRVARVVRVRNACYMIARESGKSYPAIGRALGRDHSTIIHGLSKAIITAHEEPRYRAFLKRLRTAVSNVQPFAGDRISPTVELPKPSVIVPAPPARRAVKARNDFSGCDTDKSEASMATGSSDFLAALKAAQSNIERAA
ncbi:helix-turn-helix domain-containing protein [Novosphingobium sp. Leaf2]|uniref:helix-turn-helix domain-containing protein n=1 Tax=Novosphingobium sp. Leaf2 TaxID=1735670 RepID=UPI0006FA5533|nr:helix-turn-helix domain-containing protein [Novosphingobium sp. Leaf2]KQM18397.1 hypothetical protein ASE49_09305 [Novosphingobium sp. Leaf2]